MGAYDDDFFYIPDVSASRFCLFQGYTLRPLKKIKSPEWNVGNVDKNLSWFEDWESNSPYDKFVKHPKLNVS